MSQSLITTGPLAAVLMICTSGALAEGLAPIHIALRPTASVPSSVVRIGQIAAVSDGDEAARRMIEQIDITDPPPQNGATVVSRRHVEIRVRLAGFPSTACVVGGAESTTLVLQPQESADQRVLAALHEPLARQLGIDRDDIHLRLAEPLRDTLPKSGPQTVRIEPVLDDRLGPGRASVNVRVYADNQLVDVLAIAVEIRVYRRVPISTMTIPRGAKLTADNVRFERRAISGHLFEHAPDRVIDQTARRRIRQGEVIKSYDIDPRAAVAPPPLIKPRDMVRMSTGRGQLKVIVFAGEALQSGRLGDYIRVRNVRSQNIVVGQVIGPSEVEVPF